MPERKSHLGLAPPERDLRMIVSGSGEEMRRYTQATGRPVDPAAIFPGYGERVLVRLVIRFLAALIGIAVGIIVAAACSASFPSRPALSSGRRSFSVVEL